MYLETFIISSSSALVCPFQIKSKTHLTPDPTSNRCLSFLHYVVAPSSVVNSVASKLKILVLSHWVASLSHSHLGFYFKVTSKADEKVNLEVCASVENVLFFNSK